MPNPTREIAKALASVEALYRENQKLKQLVSIKQKYRARPANFKRDRAALRRIAELADSSIWFCLDNPALESSARTSAQHAIAAIYALAKGKPETWRPK